MRQHFLHCIRSAFFSVGCALAVAWAGCQTEAPQRPKAGDKAPQLDAAAASASGLATEDVSAAIALYKTKCFRCHKSYDPAFYSSAQWQSWMTKMGKKAKLTAEQERLLSRYLDAYRASRSAPKTD